MALAALDALDRSGRSLGEFAEREGVSRQRLERWRRQLAGADVEQPTTFVEVTPPRRDQGHFEVVVGGGRVIRVPADFDAAALSRLVTVLEERC
jgi:hypothetical protein